MQFFRLQPEPQWTADQSGDVKALEHAQTKLHPLPFGRTTALDLCEQLASNGGPGRVEPDKVNYAPFDAQTPLRGGFATFRSDSLNMATLACTPMRFKATGVSHGVLLFPVQGTITIRSALQRFISKAGRSALYLPPCEAEGDCDHACFVAVEIQAAQIEEVARAMTGTRPGIRSDLLDLQVPRLLEMSAGDVRFDNLMRQYMAMLDAMNLDITKAKQSGLIETILRWVVMLMAPGLFFHRHTAPRNDTSAMVAYLCEFIDAQTSKKVTLTELQKVSGLSARSLQYSFKSTLGCTPMQWVMDRRLEAVRNRMLSAAPNATLSEIASEYFSNLGDFARLYRTRYDELPSETLAKARRSE